MNGNGAAVFALLAALLLAVPIAAQRREPFTGVVRDPAGKPLAGAQVVCAWTPDGIVLGTPDRRETKTDADGRFTLDLWIGRAYCVWAIGPADAERRRLVAAPSFEAVGGRQLDLVADHPTTPARLQVAGTTPWINEGPLSLRLYVASGAALPDLMIPGDGALSLPPLPTSLLTVCLLDAKQQVLDSIAVDIDTDPACTFAGTQQVDFVVEDLAGTRAAGARILTRHGFQHRLTPRFGTWDGSTTTTRVVAVTDAKGEASGRICDSRTEHSVVAFTAITDSGNSPIAGFFGKRRIEGGKASADEDGPFHCQVHPRDPSTVLVEGAGEDLVMHGELRGHHLWRRFNVAGVVDWRAPLNLAGAAWTGHVQGQGQNGAYAWFVGDGVSSRPLRVVMGTAGDRADLAALRTLAVHVVDADGKPAPFAAVGAGEISRGFPIHWTTHFVTDAEGRAELRLEPGPIEFYAITTTAHGLTQVADGKSTEAVIRLQPLATARFRVVDADGKPVVGARLRGDAERVPEDPIGRIVGSGLGDLFAGVISDADGLAVVRLPREADGIYMVTASWRGKTSAKASIQSDRSEPVEMRLR